MVYFAENMIVTLEEKPSKSGPQGAVRVYSNWEHDLSQPMKPMRARIAGMEAAFFNSLTGYNWYVVILIYLF